MAGPAGIYQIQYCPKCRSRLGKKLYTGLMIGMGNPEITCHKCGINLRDPDYKEWNDISFFDKIWYFVFNFLVGIFSCLIFFIPILLLSGFFIPKIYPSVNIGYMAIFIYIISYLFYMGILIFFAIKSAKRSRAKK